MYVKPLPTANFTFQPNDLNVIFSNTSQNATTYLWDFGDGQTSTEANPTHAYAAPGNYVVKLSSTNDCRTIDRTITIVLTTGLSDLTEKIAVRILPNPTPGDFRVELDSRISGPVQLSLLDARGRLAKTIQTVVKQSVTVVLFENNSLAKGVYQLNILTDGGFQTFSVVVQ
ncbi:MAG: PKD domain-containing protein [Lewinellaceae bacterium]|nr:PKD domain-containing protein [Lewinellaceae bacterium]